MPHRPAGAHHSRRSLLDPIRRGWHAARAAAHPQRFTGFPGRPFERRTFLKISGTAGLLAYLQTHPVLAKLAAVAAPAERETQSRHATDGQRRRGTRGHAATEIQTAQTAPTFSAAVFRREDMLGLDFEFFNLRLEGANLVRAAASADAYIVAVFRQGIDLLPQHVAEEVSSRNAFKDPGTLNAALAGPTRLAFRLPTGMDSIPFTLDALLSWAQWEPSVAPHALPPERALLTLIDPSIIFGRLRPAADPPPSPDDSIVIDPTDPRLDVPLVPPGIRAPRRTETAIEAPWRLILSPSALGGWAHAASPVTHNGWTELWHTRLGVRGEQAGNPGTYAVNERATFYRTVRAIWAAGFDPNTAPASTADPFEVPVDANDRWQIVRLSSDYFIDDYRPRPIKVDRLHLSPLGATLDSTGNWAPPVGQGEGLDLSQWRHIAALGRDSFVRIVNEGYLFPTGHAAAQITIAERRFAETGSFFSRGSSAYLIKERFIVVREPERGYPHAGVEGADTPWVFTNVRVTTPVTPILDEPPATLGGIERTVLPRVNGQPFKFCLVGTDLDGREVEFESELAWVAGGVEEDAANRSAMIDAYLTGPEARRRAPLRGQRLAMAPRDEVDDTTLETVNLILGVAPLPASAAAPRFIPTWTHAEVRLASVETAKGGPLGSIRISPLDQPASPANPSGVFAIVDDGVPLSFEGGESSDRSGALMTPNMVIGSLSRALGPVGGPYNPSSGPPTAFHPDQFFDEAKLMGGLLLKDILTGGLDLVNEHTPQIRSALRYPNDDTALLPEALVTRFDWRAGTEILKKDAAGVFAPLANSRLELHAVFETPLDPPAEPTYTVSGDLRSFDFNLLGDGEFHFIKLRFNKIQFTAESGKKPNVDPDIAAVDFAGPLEFVNTLQDFLHSSNPGPDVDVTPTGIRAGYTLEIPSVNVGVLSIQNIALGAALEVPFTGDPARVRFNFSEREDPFLITVYGIGGGGFFALSIGLDGVERLEAQFNAGAAIGMDFGVAAGEVHVLIGVCILVASTPSGDERTEIVAFFRIGGSVCVLGLVGVSIELYLALRHESSNDQNFLWGQATLEIEVDLLFFGPTIELSVERQLDGPPPRDELASAQLHTAAVTGTRRNYADLISESDWLRYASAYVGAADIEPGGDALVPLNPGWNLVAWQGPQTDVSMAAAALGDALRDLFTYDAPSQTFRRYSPGGPAFLNTADRLERSSGVWVLVSRAVTWRQPRAEPAQAVALSPGFNLVGWLGSRTTPDVAFASILDQVEAAFTYDTASARFRSWAPSRPGPLNDLTVLEPGDGVWLRVAGPTTWLPA